MATKASDISEARLKILVSAAAMVIVGMAVYNWVFRPQTAYLNAAGEYDRVTKNTQHKIDVLTRSIGRMEGELAELEKSDLELKAGFFDSNSGLRFLDSLEAGASESGCTIESLNYTQPKKVEIKDMTCDQLEITAKKAEIEVVGSYNNIYTFFAWLNSHPGRVSVSDVDLTTTNNYTALRCNMEVTIYIIEDKELISDVKN